MTPSEAIAAINAKAEAEHRAVEAKREELVRQVQERCVHEWIPATVKIGGLTYMHFGYDMCKNCGAQMQVIE